MYARVRSRTKNGPGCRVHSFAISSGLPRNKRPDKKKSDDVDWRRLQTDLMECLVRIYPHKQETFFHSCLVSVGHGRTVKTRSSRTVRHPFVCFVVYVYIFI